MTRPVPPQSRTVDMATMGLIIVAPRPTPSSAVLLFATCACAMQTDARIQSNASTARPEDLWRAIVSSIIAKESGVKLIAGRSFNLRASSGFAFRAEKSDTMDWIDHLKTVP